MESELLAEGLVTPPPMYNLSGEKKKKKKEGTIFSQAPAKGLMATQQLWRAHWISPKFNPEKVSGYQFSLVFPQGRDKNLE